MSKTDKILREIERIAKKKLARADQMKDYLGYVRSSGKYRSRYVAICEDGLEVSVKL